VAVLSAAFLELVRVDLVALTLFSARHGVSLFSCIRLLKNYSHYFKEI
jgi:hypothetical protein